MRGIECSRVLVASEFDEASKRALNYAGVLADCFEAELHVVHAVPPMVRGLSETGFGRQLGEVPTASPEVNEAVPSAIEALQQRLEQFVTDCLGDSQRATCEVWTAVPDEILDHRARGYDLVVMGTHERSRLERLFGSSLAKTAIDRLNRPILVVPEPAA